MIEPHEITRGLVLHLEPDVLVASGARFTCELLHRVHGPHAFLCIEAGAEGGRWLPLYSRMTTGRQPLPAHGKRGDPWWVLGTFHFDPRQVWTASHDAVVAAAHAGGDRTRSDVRNRLAESYVPVLPEREDEAGA
jgi:hypothetical protein